MRLFEPPELDPHEIEVIAKIDALRSTLGHHLGEPVRWTGILRRVAFAKAIRGSNTIEGYNVTVSDAIAAAAGEVPLEADDETWRAITGYRDAMTWVLQLARETNFAYSTDFLKSMHFMMLRYDLTKSPGRWRGGAIYVRRDPEGEVVYEGPEGQIVPALMDALIESLNRPSQLPVVVKAAMAHLNLTMIHPFLDGNGRMARCLQSLVLARGGQLSPVFSSIEEYLGANTNEYYGVLESVAKGKWNPERDARPWIRFSLKAHFIQATTFLRRTERMERIWDALEKEVKARKLPDRIILALADAAFGYKVRNPTYRAAADISRNLASHDLKDAVDAGLLIPHGEKKGRFYLGSEVIQAIRVENRMPKRIGDPFAELEQTRLPGL